MLLALLNGPVDRVIIDPEFDFRFEQISKKQGLPSNAVFSIIQDSQGFLWVATDSGLARYDGINFKTFVYQANDSGSLSSNLVNVVYEDSHGGLWVGTEDGLNKLNKANGTFTRYLGSSFNNRVRDIQEDRQGFLWIATAGGLYKYDKDNDTFFGYHHDPDDESSLINENAWTIYIDSDGKVWVGTAGGLHRYDPTRDNFMRYPCGTDSKGELCGDVVFSIYEDTMDNFWIGTNYGGLNLMNRDTGYFTKEHNICNMNDSLKTTSVWSIFEDHTGNFWIGTTDGLYIVDWSSDDCKLYQNIQGNNNSLSNNIIRTILKDNSGILWIGTNGGGINKLDSRQAPFKILGHSINDSNSLSSENVYSIIQDKYGGIYAGTRVGLDYITNNSRDEDEISIKENSNFAEKGTIRALLETQDGNLWIGTSFGLQFFNPDTGEVRVYSHDTNDQNSLSHNAVFSLCENANGNIWVGTYIAGLNVFDAETEQFVRYNYQKDNPRSLSSDGVISIYRDNENTIWIGTTNGLNKYNALTDDFTRFEHDIDDPNSLSNNYINTILEDSSGILWVGTNGGGLNAFDRQMGKFTNITIDDGLPSNNIRSIIEDESERLWLGTDQGLASYDLLNQKVVNYGSLIQSSALLEFNRNATLKDNNGQLLFGTNEGLLIFHPNSVLKNEYIPPVIITNFTASSDSESHVISELAITINTTEAPLIIDYNQNSVYFEFVALDYTAPLQNQYAYMLEGFDKDWHLTDANLRVANYTNLNSGDYVFRVKASNSDGNWNETGASLYFTITPPYWQTWWFITLMVLGVMGLIYSGYRWRLASITVQKRKLEAEVISRTAELASLYNKERDLHIQLEKEIKERSDFTRALVHELKTPLTPLVTTVDLLEESTNTKLDKSYIRNIKQGIDNLSNRVNELLDAAKAEVGLLTVKPRMVDLNPFLNDIVEYIKPEVDIFQQKIITEIPEQLPKAWIDSERVRQVILNLLINAMKFTKYGGLITLTVHVKDNCIFIVIEDDGPGISSNDLKSIFQPYYRGKGNSDNYGGLGIGLALSKTIVELHGGRISVTSEIGKGSTFTLALPITKKEDFE